MKSIWRILFLNPTYGRLHPSHSTAAFKTKGDAEKYLKANTDLLQPGIEATVINCYTTAEEIEYYEEKEEVEAEEATA